MKKSIKKTVISLALCASASCIVGGISFLRSEQEVVSAATTSPYYTLDGFTIGELASIRNTSPNGIRFQTVLDEKTRTAIAGLNLSDVSYGTLMLPADLLGSTELTHETKSVLDVATKMWQDEAETTWTSVLVGTNQADLSETYYNRPIAARSYVTGKNADGNTVYYYTENTVLRSIGYVAMMEYLAPNGNTTELIEKIVAKTDVELVFNSTGMVSAIQNSADGTTLISNELSDSSDAVATLRIGGMIAEGLSFLPEITYEVEDTSIIGVNGSTLTAEKEGETVVTASCTFNDTLLTVSKNVSTSEYRGTSDYKILITEDAKNAPDILVADFSAGGQSSQASFERAAAEKMQSVFLEATGVELPIVTSVDDCKKYISIGETAVATANTTLSSDVTAKDTASEVFVDTNGNVYIRGSVANESILYGVQQFLGETVGYDFFMENTYTTDTDVEVVVNATTYVPDMEFNMSQSDVRSDGVADGYMMQSYTRNMIALGITDDEEKGSAHYKGVAHNSVFVVNNGTYQSSSSPRYSTGQAPWKTWYATYKAGSIVPYDAYRTMDNPHTTAADYIMAELCYTAHGDDTARTALIKVVADEMIAELTQHPTLFRLGFGQMDHRVWCECTTCTKANPSDNLLEFLLDVAAAVKSRWSETSRDASEAELFKISSLFYHATGDAPKSTANYQTKLTNYGKHVEIWFAESSGDYVVPITDTTSEWNKKIYSNLKAYADIANTYNMDMLWWAYYGMVTQFFVPYDSIDAIRANYAVAAELGIDYKFNQLMQSKVNFTRLKQYLMSKLEWNAGTKNEDGTWTQVDDDTWNGWIQDYFDGAYGAGSAKMKAYYDAWSTWADTYRSEFLNSADYDNVQAGKTASDASTWYDDVLKAANRTTYFPEATLQKWLDLIDQAIAALDPNDPNYETYYWNMKLEKLTPLYLMLYVYGGNNSGDTTDTAGALLTTGTFAESGYGYVRAYGQEFLDITTHWVFDDYGEGRYLTDFNAAIESILSGVTSTTVAGRQTVVAGSSFTLTNEALVDGEYTVSVVNVNDVDNKPSATVSVSGGVATVTAALTAGETYIVELRSSTANVKFTNVLAISGYLTTVDQLQSISGSGYYVLANDINCANATLNAISFTGILDGDNKTVSNFTVGANGMFAAKATVKNVTFADFTVASGTVTQESVFGAASSFENVNVNAENTSGLWDNGINVNYVKAEKRAYVVSGQKDTTLYSDIFVKGNIYTVTIDGVDTTVTAYTNGKLNLTVGSLPVGAQKTVLCRENGLETTYVFDVIGITKFITNASELAALGVGGKYNADGTYNGNPDFAPIDSNVAGFDVDGYYALANDIDCGGRVFSPGHNYAHSNFIGTFDGNGYTISNLGTYDSGIFGGLKNATIKNVNFTGVMIDVTAPPSGSGWSFGWNYGGLFANTASNTTFENINAQYDKIYFNDDSTALRHVGLFVANGTTDVVYRNVTFNVAAATTRVENTLPSIFGSNLDVTSLDCENVTIYMKVAQQNAGVTYGYPDTNKTNAITTKPGGVSIINAFSITNTEREIAAGESLTITTHNDTGKPITFSLESAVDGVSVDPEGVVKVEDYVLPNTTFTVVAAIEGFADKVTFTVAKWNETLGENVVMSLEDGVFTLPESISGEVEYVKLGDLTLYDAATGVGSVADSVYTADSTAIKSASAGAGQTLTVGTEMTKYTLTATVATKYIKTTQDLRDLGVGGTIYDGTYNNQTERNPTYNNSNESKGGGNANSGVAGNDVTGYYVLANDLDFAGEQAVAAGYSFQKSWFKGTFDGNGHTIKNITINEGGIFGGLYGATVKNVKFTGVVYDLTLGVYAGQHSQQAALLAHIASNSTFENINVQIVEYKMHPNTSLYGSTFVHTTWNVNTLKNVYIDASGVTLDWVLSTDSQSQTVYEDVTIIAEGYNKIGKLGSTEMTKFPENVAFMRPFTITNTATEVEVGKAFDMTVSRDDVSVSYTLKEAVDGVTIGDNTVNVAGSVALGTQFTVVATSSEGYVQEMTFTVGKAQVALTDVVTFETYNNTTVTLPASIEGTVARVTVDGVELYNSATGYGSLDGSVLTVGGMPVAQANLGENKAMVVETDGVNYTLNANVYTMIINDAAELDQWQAISAQVAVDQGLSTEAQKGFVYSGYFALGGDIEYNKTWTPYKAYGALWAFYGNKDFSSLTVQEKSSDGKAIRYTDGSINEDWGVGYYAGFKGVFDGNGYAIKGMETSGEYSGFIVTMGGGTIKDVAFTNAKIGSTASLVANRGNGTFENVYVQVVSMASGVSGKFTNVLRMNTNTYHPTNANGYSDITNVIVDVSAVDFANLKYAYMSNISYTRANGLYVIGVPTDVTLSNTAGTEAPLVFLHNNPNTVSPDYDIANAYVDASSLMADETHSANVKAWGEPWSTVDNAIYFGDYVVYDGLVEIVAETVDVNFGHTLSGTSVVLADTATVDLSEIYDNYLAGNTVTVKYGEAVIYEGTIDSASWAMPLTAFTAKDGGVKQIVFVIGNTKVTLPINIVQNVVKLNSTNVTNPTALKSILDSNPYGSYVLTSDLDMNGASLSGVEHFYGTLDGQGYMITNTYIYHSAGYSITGSYDPFFIMNNNGTIKNIGFDLDYITYTTGGSKRGIVYTNNGTIENVYVSVSLKEQANSSWASVGVVVGTNTGTVNNVIADITVADGISLDVTDLKVAAVLTNNNTVANVYVITNGNDQILGVANGTTSGATTYTAWGEMSADTITAMGTPWSVVDKAIYFGNVMLYDGTLVVEIDETVTVSESDGAIALPDTISGNVTSVTLGDVQIFNRESGIGSIDGNVVTADATALASVETDVTVAMRVVTDEGIYDLWAIVESVEPEVVYYVPTNTSYEELTAYDGDVTALGFAEGTTIYERVITDSWNQRIIYKTDDSYDYLEFDIRFTANVPYLTVWPAKDKATKGDMQLYPRGMTTSNGLVRTVQVFKANGDTIAAQSSETFAANTNYTIRIGFNSNEELNEFHIAAAQTLYVTNGRTYKYSSTDLRVYDGSTGKLHAYYDGDVTALGFAAGTKVAAVNNTSAWSTRVNVGGDRNYDYVDVQIAADKSIGSFLIWTYETSGFLSGKRWDFATATGAITFGEGTPAYPDKRIQLFNENGDIAKSFETNKVYTLRIHLNGESYVHVGTGTTATLYFGDINYGHAYDLDETTTISRADGTFTLPELVSGNIENIIINNVTVYKKATGLGSIDGNVVTPDATALASITLGETYMDIQTDDGWYIANAIVATDVITTIDELKALGVGGGTVNSVLVGQGNSDTAGNDITGYYVLGNDLDGEGALLAAGYSYQKSWFKGTFNGNGHTIANITVNTGGIFGGMSGATVKNVNFTGVVYDMTLGNVAGNYSQNTALFAHVAANSTTFENIHVQVDAYKNTTTFRGATIYYTGWAGVKVNNVVLEANGIALDVALGFGVADDRVTYTDVTIKAASYKNIAYVDNNASSTEVTEFPSGVTFKTVANGYAQNNGTKLSAYAGDETALGFAEGTIVYESVQDVRTSMWSAGTNGYTMEQQALRLYKVADEDYASVQFSLSRDISGTHAFFAWALFEDGTGPANGAGYLYNNGTPVASNSDTGFNAAFYDADGNQVTSGLKANTVYTMKWYYTNATVFKIGCAVADGSPITLYFTNMSSGNDA